MTTKKNKSDVIVVLGGGLTARGTLPLHIRVRLKTAIMLMRKERIPRIICAGWYGFTLPHIPRTSEAHAMKAFLQHQGIPPHAIFCEELSKDTIGNAYFVKKLFLRRFGWKNVTVVTSRFHAQRTRYIFTHVLGNHYRVRVFPAPDTFQPKELVRCRETEKRLLQVTRLWLGHLPPGHDNKLRRLLHHEHPGYAKKVHPFTQFLFHLLTKGQH